ncbi:MAG: hypothetical protein HDR92_10445 [Bacteroides sp.]|nr:hypothetical protein [Bacteroides sp.]
MKLLNRTKNLAAVVFAMLLTVLSPNTFASDTDDDIDSGEIVINKDNGNLNPPGPINRMPAMHGRVITASYSAPMLTFNSFGCDPEYVQLTISTTDGSTIIEGHYPAGNLLNGICIGYIENFVISITCSDGRKYSGYYFQN